MDANDIFVWLDGFWCYRSDFIPAFVRFNDKDYRVIDNHSPEWVACELRNFNRL